MKSKKQGIAFILAVIMIISTIPFSVFGADDQVFYEKTGRPAVGIMNSINSENDLFRRTYLRSTDDNFNLVYKFNRTSANNVAGADTTLSYKTSMMHYESGDYWKAHYGWTYQQRKEITVGGPKYTVNEPTPGNEGVGELFSSGEIKMDFSADLIADDHRNYLRHDAKILDRAYASLEHKDERGNYSLMSMASDKNAPDESPVNFRKTERISNGSFLGLQLYFTGLGCKCGSSKVSKVSLGLIDDVNPTIRTIYASSDSEGKVKESNGFNAGETGYLNLQFSEKIRFANDEVPNEQIMLNLIINGAENNVQIKTIEVQARLVRLESNKMVFKFTVPETVADKTTNVYISGIANEQDWVNNLGGENKFHLTLLGKNGKEVTLSENLSIVEELIKTSSLVTDIAGNPVNWKGSTKNLSQFCFLDNVPPIVSTVEIKGARISSDSNQTSQAVDWPKDIDRSAVFAGIGDTLTYSVKFNEVMEIPEGVDIDNVKAVLNAKDNGSPVTLKGKSIETIDNGVNGIKVSRITFEPVIITKDMVPDGTRKPLKIDELTFPARTVDLRRNVMDNLKNEGSQAPIPAPAQQQYLDTQLAVAETSITPEGVEYTPVFYGEGNREKEFYFPIIVKDIDGIGGGAYASGINGTKGSFAWLDETAGGEYSFDYYVSALSDKPDDSKYMGAMTSSEVNKLNEVPFTQVSEGNYIHIRLRDEIKYNMNESAIIVMAGDYAQNKGYDKFNLNFSADYVPPEIVKVGEKNRLDSITEKGTMSVIVSLKDPSGVNPEDVEYQWVAKDSEPADGQWVIFTGETEELTDTSLKVKIEKTELEAETTHENDLLIRAKDKRGNVSEDPFRISCVYDLIKANPNLEIKDGFDIPTKDIVIGMELDKYSGDDENLKDQPATSVLMIKNPQGAEDEYFVTIISKWDGYGEPFITNDLFADRSTEYDKWYSVRVTKNDDGSFNFAESEELGYYDNSSERKLLDSIINHEKPSNEAYYGDVELTFVTAYGNTASFKELYRASGYPLDGKEIVFTDDGRYDEHTPFYLEQVDGAYVNYNTDECFYFRYSTEGLEAQTTTASGIVGSPFERVDVELPITRIQGELNVQEYKLMLAPEKFIYDRIGLDFGDVVQSDGTPGLMWNEEDYEPGGTPKYLENLDGAKIPFALKNPIVDSWGVAEMDFESKDTYVALYYSEHGPNSNGQFAYKNDKPLDFSDGGGYTYVYQIKPLIKTKIMQTDGEQEFIIPYGITDKTGFYTLEISVKALNTDKVKKFYYTEMFVDGSKAVGNGLEHFDISVLEEDNYVHRNYKYLGEADDKDNIILGTGIQDGYNKEISIGLDIEPGRYKELIYREKTEGGGFDTKFLYTDRSRGYIKVWNAVNASGGKAPDYVQWQPADDSMNVKTVEKAADIGPDSYTDAEGNPCLPLLKDGSNIICYQIVRSNGSMSSVMQINITTASDIPKFELKLDSDGSEGWVSSVTAFAENVAASNGAKSFNIASNGVKNFNIEWSEVEEDMAPVVITDNGEYYFYVEDNAGNVSIVKRNIDWIDSYAPNVSTENIEAGTPENEFHVKVTMEDNNDLTEGKLFITFDKEYSSLLNRKETVVGSEDGENKDEFVSMEVPSSKNGTGEWTSSESAENKVGIYKTKTIISDDKLKKTVEIWGAFKYDDSTDAAEQSDRMLTFTGADQAGNISQAYETEFIEGDDGQWYEAISDDRIDGTYINVNAKNIKPEFETATLMSDDRVKLEFTAPVLVTSPTNSNLLYGSSTDSAAIYSDGLCNIVYRDLFGKEYKEDKNIVVFGKFNVSVKFSETEPTQNDVMVFVEIPDGSDAVITGIKSGAVSGDISQDEKSASITMIENGAIVLSMEGKGEGSKDRNITVSNIDRQIEAITPYWYYAGGEPAFGNAAEGPVTAGLYCNELLTGTNGPLTHTFTDGAKKGDTYTFEYEDMAKNKGSNTATLMHDVVYALEDTTPPEYSVALYSRLDYFNRQGDSFIKGTSLENAVNNLPKAQGYMLLFNVFDESKVKLIIKNIDSAKPGYGDISETIDGVTVSDRAVTVEKDSEFNIYLVDEKGNSTGPLAMKFDKIDTTAPTATVEYAASTFYSTVGYLIPSEYITVTNVTGVEKTSGGTYDGKYYHKYDQNEDFIFYYKDEVGNIASTEAKVDWLDVNPPELISLKWTPVGAGQKEGNGIYPPPVSPINRDVIAQIEFNKTVQEVKAYKKGTNVEADSFKGSIQFIQNGAVVTYSENADIDLYFKSYNGKDAKFSMGSVACIDKIQPVISDSYKLSTDRQSVEYTFTASKDVYMAEGKELEEAAKTFKYTFTANGTYDMHFTDKAGNSVVHKVEVKDLDKEIMKVYFNTEQSDTGAVEGAGKLKMDGKNAFYVKLSKAGTVTYDGTSKTAAKDEWIKYDFTLVQDKFFYAVETKDIATGTRTFNYIGVEPTDKVPPVIILASTVISLKEGSMAVDITEKLNKGVSVSDNKDNGLTVSIKAVTTEAGVPVQITDNIAVGRYKVEYTAADNAGNSSSVFRTLRIYSKNSVNVMMNGAAAEPEGTMVLKTQEIVLNIENLPGKNGITEPCRVYYKAGIMTAGQMKIRASKVETDTFVLPGTGFYTIYIQAQDRKDYITYVYIEK